jgi:hypothetical protein
MKKFAQTAVIIAGVIGLSACAGTAPTEPYGDRTAGDPNMRSMSQPAMRSDNGDMEALNMCLERESRLKSMNKSCYRK